MYRKRALYVLRLHDKMIMTYLPFRHIKNQSTTKIVLTHSIYLSFTTLLVKYAYLKGKEDCLLRPHEGHPEQVHQGVHCSR